MNNKTTLLVSLFFLCFTAWGQNNTWPLQKCIEKGIENNLEIKIRQLEIKRVQKSRSSIINSILPTINLIGNQSYNFGSTIDPSTNGRVSSNIQYDNFYINANMNLIDFNAYANREKSKIDIEKAKVDKEVIENEYKLQILESYYQALYTQELAKIQREQLKNAQLNLERINKEVTIGSKPKSDLYDFQLSFTQEEKRILETEQLLEMQKLQLFQLMNATEEYHTNVVLVPTKNKSSVTSNTENENPKIKLALLNYQSSSKELKSIKAANLPVLSSYYSISSFYYKPLNQPNILIDDFNTQIKNNKNQQVGIQLIVPIFNGFRNNKRFIASKIETEKNKYRIEQEKIRINNQIAVEEKTKENYLQLKSKLKASFEYSVASFTTSSAKFEAGKIDAYTFSIVKNFQLATAFDVLKNELQIEFLDLKINLIKYNQL